MDSEQIGAALREHGFGAVVDRLNYLRQLAADDPDEPRLRVDSVRELARFLLTERGLPHPQIGVSPDGLAHAEWTIPAESGGMEGGGILALGFLGSGGTRFAAVSATSAQEGAVRRRVNGMLPTLEVAQAVQSFTSALALHP